MLLVVGGSGSGKSACAEQIAVKAGDGGSLFYLATMQIYDAEGEKKVARHRKLREGKGFCTIEQPRDLAEAAGKIREAGNRIRISAGQREASIKAVALLECMSNLVANEMFPDGEPQRTADMVAEKVIREVKLLLETLEELVIVTNNVFEDGILYDPSTVEYNKALGAVNTRLAAMADTVVEVVVGIPVLVKGEIPGNPSQEEREEGASI